jgi:hypothetical protein
MCPKSETMASKSSDDFTGICEDSASTSRLASNEPAEK